MDHFSGSATADMMTYIKPPLKRNPDCFIIHRRTSNLKSKQDPENIAINILENVNSSKNDTSKVLISSIVPRKYSLNGKGCLVIIFLETFLWKKIHLNTLGSRILADNFIRVLNAPT